MDREENKKDLDEKTKKTTNILNMLLSSKKIWLVALVVVVLLALLIGIVTSRKGKTTISISSILNEKTIKSELSTLMIPYSSVYKAEEPKKNAKDEVKYKYYAKYEGYTKLGLNFDKVIVDENTNSSEVYIKLPKIIITEAVINKDSIDIIYENSKYDKEGYLIEVIAKECQEDMTKKVNDNKKFYENAKDSAILTIKHFLEPIVGKNKKIVVEIE